MRRRLAAARVGELATIGPAGRPHVVPICFALAGDHIVSAVDAKPKTTTGLRRLDNVRGNPDVSLLVHAYDEDWTQLWWVRVDGRAEVVEDGPIRADAIEALAAKYPQYRTNEPPGAVIRIAIETWRGWAWVG